MAGGGIVNAVQGSIFDGWPEAERVIEIPVTSERLIGWFCHRNAYNSTHRGLLEMELRALLADLAALERGNRDV